MHTAVPEKPELGANDVNGSQGHHSGSTDKDIANKETNRTCNSLNVFVSRIYPDLHTYFTPPHTNTTYKVKTRE